FSHLAFVGFKTTVPCSGMVIAWTGLAKGKVESALIIVSLSLILAIFLIPLWMFILVGTYVQIDIWMMIEKLLLIILLPLVAGLITRVLLVKKIGEKKFNEIKPILPIISTFGMFAIVFIAISMEANILLVHLDYIVMVVIGIVILYPSLSLIAVVFSKYTAFTYGDCMALTYGVTAKNHSITMAIAVTTFGGLAVLPAAFAPIIQIPLMLIILRLAPKIEGFIEKVKEEVEEF
ncbi:MAG: arsenic resistance protein, partial [Candidatus Helarchaeota archaeon]